MDKLLFSITEAGALLGRGKSTAYAMAASGELETVVVGHQRMVPAEALRTLVDRLRAEAAAKSPNRVTQLVDLLDDEGRVDVALIPAGTTLADLAEAKRLIEHRGVTHASA